MRAPEKTLAVVDHNIQTTDRSGGIEDPESRLQVEQLADNAREFGIEYYDEFDRRQGVVHIIGPEQGFTLPGTTIVCGDSHTSTHGAFGALAHGIGTSEVEHVLATQTLIQTKAKNMRVTVDGALRDGVTAKDIILAIIGEIGTAGGTGHVIEYRRRGDPRAFDGRADDGLQHVDRGRRAGGDGRAGREDLRLSEGPPEIAQGRVVGPGGRLLVAARHRRGRAFRLRSAPRRRPTCRRSSPGAPARRTSFRSAAWCRASRTARREHKRASIKRSLDYMGLNGGEKITDIAIDRVFIGSCTNGRIEDLRAAARIVEGRKVADRVKAMVVPGSGLVKAQAEQEGLDAIFKAAGFEWREPGCSMCLAMNPDKLAPGERCASTSNRNFEGRQGHKGRTHLVSPAMAAAAAIAGRFVDVREWR